MRCHSFVAAASSRVPITMVPVPLSVKFVPRFEYRLNAIVSRRRFAPIRTPTSENPPPVKWFEMIVVPVYVALPGSIVLTPVLHCSKPLPMMLTAPVAVQRMPMPP